MLTVEKAVLQIMDGTSDLCVLSQKEMDLNDPETRGFLEKHMGRILADPAGHEGQFWNDSGFAATMQRYNIGEIPFTEFAGVVGSACYESFRQLDKAEGADLVLAQFNQDGRSLIALMLLGHKSAYTHQALTEDGALSNQLLRHQAILPGPGQKLDSWAVADPFSFEVRFAEKRRRCNNQDFELLRQAVLQCDAAPSTRETVKAVQQIAVELAAEQGADPVQTVQAATRVKASLAQQGQTEEKFAPLEAAREVFSELEDPEPVLKEFEERVRQAGLPAEVKVEPTYAAKTARTHKIKTDTGIELTVPAEYFENPEYIQFLNNPDGTLSIQLNHIGSIENK